MFRLRLAAPLALLGWTLAGCHAADRAAVASPNYEGLVVTGQGDAMGTPDVAHIELGVQARAADVQQATQQVNDQMRKVIDALVAQGIDRKDVQTRNLSIHEERVWEPPPRPMGPEGTGGPSQPDAGQLVFVANNTLSVTLHDLERMGTVLGAASAAGVNQMYGIQLEVDNPATIEQAALDEAFADAKAKAERLAQTSGVRLGRILSIQVGDVNTFHPPIPMASARMKDEAADSSMPVERGQVEVQQTVQVQYEIEK
jgi:uncharacterized protein YggE